MKTALVVIDYLPKNAHYKQYILSELANNYHVTLLMRVYDSESISYCSTKSIDKIKYMISIDEDIKRIKQSATHQISNFLPRRLKKRLSLIKTKVLKTYKSPFNSRELEWFKYVQNYNISVDFDYVFSFSHSPASHHAAALLLETLNKAFWIQIWFEPWYINSNIRKKPKKLLAHEIKFIKNANLLFYVTPYFLNIQKKHFSNYKHKMYNLDLPSKEFPKSSTNKIEEYTIGYYGNYNKKVRNILPFYKIVKKLNLDAVILGTSNLKLKSTNKTFILPNTNQDTVIQYENDTKILVILGNYGDHIPGKVYNLAASNKYLLYILDGSDYKKKSLKEYFKQFNRYIFCENNQDDIKQKISDILNGEYGEQYRTPIYNFTPENVVNNIMSVIEREEN